MLCKQSPCTAPCSDFCWQESLEIIIKSNTRPLQWQQGELYTCSNKMSMLNTTDYPDNASVTNPIPQPVVLSHSQWELGSMKVFPQLFPPALCYSWEHSMVILSESPFAAETLIWNIASCTPWNSKCFPGPPVTQEPGGEHGRNRQQESP